MATRLVSQELQDWKTKLLTQMSCITQLEVGYKIEDKSYGNEPEYLGG